MNQIEIKKFDFIDALRGWAILAVIIMHVSQWIPPTNRIVKDIVGKGGHGVGLFFVASSLTLFLSMSARNKKEEKPILKYFIRRFFRIAPLFYSGIIVYALIKGLGPNYYAPNGIHWHHFLLTATFLNGWFPDTINAIVPGGWSIATEMMFYLIMPFLFKKLKSKKETLIALLASIIFAKIIFILGQYYYNTYYSFHPDLIYAFQNWWILAQIPVFLAGILLFHTIKNDNAEKLDKSYGTILLSISIFLLISFLKTKSYFELITSYYFYAFAFYVFALSLYVNPNFLFVNKLTTMLGKYSYSLYLSHFAVIRLMEFLSVESYIINGDIGYILGCLIVVNISLCISYVTYNLIEKPGILLGKKVIGKIS